jgi:hypothetical protein
MIAVIIVIILIATVIFFWDDFPKWVASAKKFWNELPVLFDRNIRTKPKANVTKEDALKIQRQMREQMEEQMKEAKKGFQEILDSHKQGGYTQTLNEKISKFQQQIDSRKGSRSKSLKGQTITDWERRFLWDGINRRKRVPCINCESEDMYKGGIEGSYQHWICPTCGQRIKLSFQSNSIAGFSCVNLGTGKRK